MFVSLVDAPWGNDLKVVNAARVSFGKRKTVLEDSDVRLIQYLARGIPAAEHDEMCLFLAGERDTQIISEVINKWRDTAVHWTAFGHCGATLEFRIPMFVANQIKRHTVGFVINEESRRYVSTEPEMYSPMVWRQRPSNGIKQGSEKTPSPKNDEAVRQAYYLNEHALMLYNEFVDPEGEYQIAPEQARMLLPQAMYVNFWMSGSLYAWANLCKKRLDPHTQEETRRVAAEIGGIMFEHFPHSWHALMEYGELKVEPFE